MTLTGTVTDGRQGLSAMSLVSHNLTAKKATALFPHGLVSLVAAVKCASDNEVFSTIDSQIVSGDVALSIEGKAQPLIVPVGTVRKQFDKVKWVHHNQTGYYTVPGVGSQSIEISHVLREHRTHFEIGVSHGKNSTNSTGGLAASAAWLTLPGVALSSMIQRGLELNVTVVTNTKDAQAVLDVDQTLGMAVFWSSGAVVVFPPPLYTVSAQQPAVVIITKLVDGSVST